MWGTLRGLRCGRGVPGNQAREPLTSLQVLTLPRQSQTCTWAAWGSRGGPPAHPEDATRMLASVATPIHPVVCFMVYSLLGASPSDINRCHPRGTCKGPNAVWGAHLLFHTWASGSGCRSV